MNRSESSAARSAARLLAASVALASLSAGTAFGQTCKTATISPYDCGTANPVTLTTRFPGEYPVLGATMLVEAQGAQPGSAAYLVLGVAGKACIPLPSRYRGDLLLAPPPGWTLFPSFTQPSWNLSIPPDSSLAGTPFHLQSVHTNGFDFDLSNGLEGQIGFYQAEIEIVSIATPSGLIGGIGPANIPVTVRNNGNAPATFPLTVCLGGNCATVTVNLAPFTTSVIGVNVAVPPSFGGCGQVNNFPLSACTNFIDCNPANNCVSVNAPIAVPYWDLDYEIVGEPSSGYRCQTVNWTVRIRNRGNIPSANVPSLSAITAQSGSGNYNQNLGMVFFTTPNIPPGGTWDYRVNNYFISCGAFLQTQWIKAEVNYSAGGSDLCNPGNNNFDQESIQIRP